MDDNVVLKFMYKGKETEPFVDVDLVNLLDMIIDYWDTAEREEHLMLEHPSFSHVYKKRHVQLGDDKALLEMFSRHKGKDSICVHVGDTKSNAPLDNARRLRETLKHNAQKDVKLNPTSAKLDDEDDDDVVMFIPTPSVPCEKQPVLNVHSNPTVFCS